ncbi:hypothetical protein B9Z55_024893 [Caenorhabditis nigoni]|nr:hypothetical protein B9Z55_024893 [Caenorhabditis nigoni]
MKKIIKSSQRNRFENIKSLNYKCYRNSHPIIYIRLKNGQKTDLLAVTKRQKFEGPECFSLNVSGKLIDFKFYKYYATSYFGRFVATFNPDESTAVIESIHKYNLHFFGNSVDYYWRTEDHEINIPKLQNVSTCMELWYISPDTDNLNDFFSTSPNLKSISIRTTTPRELVRPDSKFYQAECVDTFQSYITFPDIFHHFQGKRTFIQCRRVEWYNEKKEDKNTEAGPITSCTYVVRETDKHVASVLIQGDIFRFGVWDMTEEEFLRMIE